MTLCNCESSYCAHAPGDCDRDATGGERAMYVGAVCSACAERMRETGGARYLLPDDDGEGR